MSKYYKDTMECPSICPYCGSGHTDFIDDFDGEEKWVCRRCGEDYLVQYAEDSWDEGGEEYTKVEDVTDRHRNSLKEI